MRISLIGPVYPYRGGIAHHTALLARALGQSHAVQVISFRSQYPAWLYPGKSDREPGPPLVPVSAQYVLSPLNPLSWIRTVRAVTGFGAQAVVFPWWVTFWAPAFGVCSWLLRRKRVPVIFLIHNTLPHEAQFYDRALTRAVFQQGSGFVVQSQREQDRLLGLYPHARLQTVSHPVYNQFTERRSKEEARRELGLPAEGPVILFFGFVRAYKGLKYLLEALALSPLKDDRPCLVVAGEIWKEKEAYLAQIEALGLASQVRLVDSYIPDEEIPSYFAAADVFAAPYTGGSQSGSLKLAFGFGLPVVASEVIAGDEERRLGGDLLTVVPPADAHSLAEALARVLREPPAAAQVTPPGGDGWQALVHAIEELL